MSDCTGKNCPACNPPPQQPPSRDEYLERISEAYINWTDSREPGGDIYHKQQIFRAVEAAFDAGAFPGRNRGLVGMKA